MRAREARILQPAPNPHNSYFTKEIFTATGPLYRVHPPPHLAVHSCLAPSSFWFIAGPDLQPADLGVDLSPELTLVLGTSHSLSGLSSPYGAVLSPTSLGVPLGGPARGGMCCQLQFCFVAIAVHGIGSPLSPLAPVLGREVQTLGVDPKEPLEHSSLVSVHDVL